MPLESPRHHRGGANSFALCSYLQASAVHTTFRESLVICHRVSSSLEVAVRSCLLHFGPATHVSPQVIGCHRTAGCCSNGVTQPLRCSAGETRACLVETLQVPSGLVLLHAQCSLAAMPRSRGDVSGQTGATRACLRLLLLMGAGRLLRCRPGQQPSARLHPSLYPSGLQPQEPRICMRFALVDRTETIPCR